MLGVVIWKYDKYAFWKHDQVRNGPQIIDIQEEEEQAIHI